MMQRMLRALLDLVALACAAYLGVELFHHARDLAERRAEQRSVSSEAARLYAAFELFRERNGAFPDDSVAMGFDPATLDPLRRRGYYKGTLTSRLAAGRADAYEAPDDGGKNQEFWLEMTLASDPAVRFVVARSDDAPLGEGRWLDGAYLSRRGHLVAVR